MCGKLAAAGDPQRFANRAINNKKEMFARSGTVLAMKASCTNFSI